MPAQQGWLPVAATVAAAGYVQDLAAAAAVAAAGG